jgi:hypothetical protein
VCIRWVAAAALVLGALLNPFDARASGQDQPTPLPYDVGVVGQDSDLGLGELPADFQQIDSGWLVLEFPASVRARVLEVAHDAVEFRSRLSEDLGQPVLAHVLVRIARTPDQMTALAPHDAPPPEYASGVAYPAEHLVLLSLQAPYTWQATDLIEVLRHELTHVALADAVGRHHVPRWFDEGLAVAESGELRLHRMEVLWDAVLSRRLLPLTELDRSFPDATERSEVGIAYAESADVVRFLMRDTDRARFGSLVQRVRDGVTFERGLDDAYGTNVRKLEYEWREDVSHRFGLFPMLTSGALLWTFIAGLSVAAWVRKRRRAQAKLAQWAREEAAAAEAAAMRAGVSEHVDETQARPIPQPVASIPVIEHDGRWYTLH